MASRVFISHSSDDKYFVDLLAELLKFHYIDTWYCHSDISPGTKYLAGIDDAISKADILIVVISKNTLNSTWVTREITAFHTQKPEAEIIPLFLDQVNPDDVFKGLEGYQALYFYKSMLTGFKMLLEHFGKEFLPKPERRKSKDRRVNDRRQIEDRRKSPMVQRLRIGFWKCYAAATGASKFDDFILSVHSRMKVMEILREEISKHQYFDKDGKPCEEITQKDLDRITYEVWEDMGKRNYLTAIIVIEAIAEKINQKYEVKMCTQRGTKEDRRSKNGRRNRA